MVNDYSCVNEGELKYALTEETKVFNGIILHRIKALRAFGSVPAGSLGGWIEKEDNLSFEGNCWVYDDAMVMGDARVEEDAVVYEEAQVYHRAKITQFANVYGCARVYGYAQVGDYAHVHGTCNIYEFANVRDGAEVYGSAEIHGSAFVGSSAKVHGVACVYGAANLENGEEVTRGDVFRHIITPQEKQTLLEATAPCECNAEKTAEPVFEAVPNIDC